MNNILFFLFPIILFTSDTADLPQFQLIHPTPSIHRLYKRWHVQFDHPQFSPKYHLYCQDATIRQYFSHPILTHLIHHPIITLEGYQNQLLYYQPDHLIPPITSPNSSTKPTNYSNYFTPPKTSPSPNNQPRCIAGAACVAPHDHKHLTQHPR